MTSYLCGRLATVLVNDLHTMMGDIKLAFRSPRREEVGQFEIFYVRMTFKDGRIGDMKRQNATFTKSQQIDHKIFQKQEMIRVPAQEPKLRKQTPFGFDGASDYFSSLSHNTDNRKLNHHNTGKPRVENWPVPTIVNNSMDLDRDAARFSPRSPIKPKPLHVRKQSSHVQLARSQQHLNQNKTYQEHYKTPVYPPRTSPTREGVQSFDIPQDHATLAETPSGLNNTTRSSLSSYRDRYISGISVEAPSTGVSTTRSTVSSYKESYLSDASPEIMGDFVPINPLDMAYRPATAEGSKVVFHR
jgi:hypothetical protein